MRKGMKESSFVPGKDLCFGNSHPLKRVKYDTAIHVVNAIDDYYKTPPYRGELQISGRLTLDLSKSNVNNHI